MGFGRGIQVQPKIPTMKAIQPKIPAIRPEMAAQPMQASKSIAINTARKNGLRLPPPSNYRNMAKQVPPVSPVSGAGRKKSPFYTDRPRVQDGKTTMEYLESAVDSLPTSENMEKSSYGKNVPSMGGQPFSKGTRHNLSDEAKFLDKE